MWSTILVHGRVLGYRVLVRGGQTRRGIFSRSVTGGVRAWPLSERCEAEIRCELLEKAYLGRVEEWYVSRR